MTRIADALFMATKGIRSVRVVYAGFDAHASFKQGEQWVEDANGFRTLEQETTLLFDSVTAENIGLAAQSNIDVYPVEEPTGTPTTFRVKQLRDEQDGLYVRAVIGVARNP